VQTINLTIEGYWRDINKRGLPIYSGIFFVYQTKYNPASDTVNLLKVLYVGEAENVRDRILSHPRYPAWISYLMEGEELSFSAGYVDGSNRTRVKAAFIFKLRPIANTDYKEFFPFEKITVLSAGKTSLLDTDFSVGV
jgi:hypothetical protein